MIQYKISCSETPFCLLLCASCSSDNMSDLKEYPTTAKPESGVQVGSGDEENFAHDDDGSSIDKQTYAYSEDRKIGIAGAVFLILNKMIGTGSTLEP